MTCRSERGRGENLDGKFLKTLKNRKMMQLQEKTKRASDGEILHKKTGNKLLLLTKTTKVGYNFDTRISLG